MVENIETFKRKLNTDFSEYITVLNIKFTYIKN